VGDKRRNNNARKIDPRALFTIFWTVRDLTPVTIFFALSEVVAEEIVLWPDKELGECP